MSSGPGILDKIRLDPLQVWQHQERMRKRLESMSPEERRAYEEAREADSLREALSDESWGSA